MWMMVGQGWVVCALQVPLMHAHGSGSQGLSRRRLGQQLLPEEQKLHLHLAQQLLLAVLNVMKLPSFQPTVTLQPMRHDAMA